MGRSNKKLLVVQVAALGYDAVRAADGAGAQWLGLDFAPMESVFPAVTCTVQGSFRTASKPSMHGMVANGRYFRDLRKVMFWEQSAALVAGERIWSGLRGDGGKVAMLFWQQSLGEDVDVVLSPAPIHKHHGGMIQDCYSRPEGLYSDLRRRIGKSFKLHHYWGPAASAKVGKWISAATAEILTDKRLAPDLCLTYLPTLDYDFQRFGPVHDRSAKAMKALGEQLGGLLGVAAANGYEVVVFGDYAMTATHGPAVLPNLALRRAGMLQVRRVGGMLYPDFYSSSALAMVDHEVAHVYLRRADDVDSVRKILTSLSGVDKVLDSDAQRAIGLDHPNSGELVLVADEGRWFAYPWWADKRDRPDYASHIDIHNKPGFDPCELFFGWPPPSVSQDTSRIGGTHGRAGAQRPVAWAATRDLGDGVGDIVTLAAAVRNWMR